jgi:hypothetical protein
MKESDLEKVKKVTEAIAKQLQITPALLTQ